MLTCCTSPEVSLKLLLCVNEANDWRHQQLVDDRHDNKEAQRTNRPNVSSAEGERSHTKVISEPIVIAMLEVCSNLANFINTNLQFLALIKVIMNNNFQYCLKVSYS